MFDYLVMLILFMRSNHIHEKLVSKIRSKIYGINGFTANASLYVYSYL